MIKILIVEDDKEINRLLKDYLTKQNYNVITVFNGFDAISAIKNNKKEIEFVLLDLMLPLKSGDRVLKEIREISDVPIMVVSAKDTVQTKIDIIKMGADDYITKPFDLDEISARIEAVLRRINKYKQNTEPILRFKELSLNTQNKIVCLGENQLDLTSTEFLILELLMKYPTKLFSKTNLFESIWNENCNFDDNTVKVHISNLRNKIRMYTDNEYIETVWGMGYRLKK